MHTLVQWLLDTIGAMGYPGIFLLMAMESSVIPVPSELVMPPAGYLAFQGKMSMGLAILCGTLGSLVGALRQLLRLPLPGPAADPQVRQVRADPAAQVRAGGALFPEPRRDLDLHRQTSAGCTPSDLDSGRTFRH